MIVSHLVHPRGSQWTPSCLGRGVARHVLLQPPGTCTAATVLAPNLTFPLPQHPRHAAFVLAAVASWPSMHDRLVTVDRCPKIPIASTTPCSALPTVGSTPTNGRLCARHEAIMASAAQTTMRNCLIINHLLLYAPRGTTWTGLIGRSGPTHPPTKGNFDMPCSSTSSTPIDFAGPSPSSAHHHDVPTSPLVVPTDQHPGGAQRADGGS